MVKESQLYEIRAFNRYYTDLLGLLDKHLLESELSLTEARILFEIQNHTCCTAQILSELLQIDKGYLSRTLKKFERRQYLIKIPSRYDARLQILQLTEQGKSLHDLLNTQSNEQLSNLLDNLSDEACEKLIASYKNIQQLLSPSYGLIDIRAFKPKDLLYIKQSHISIYQKEFGFSDSFIDYIEKNITAFEQTYHQASENIWLAYDQNLPVGSIAIVNDTKCRAQLRWFLVEPSYRNQHIGRRLMEEAIRFARDAGYQEIFLWTVQFLSSAKYLYSQFGFECVESKLNTEWGYNIIEEKWSLSLV
jgi:DNA-binding MarR family transcriptional regulator/GNAT superfamily N-acetyltransferase